MRRGEHYNGRLNRLSGGISIAHASKSGRADSSVEQCLEHRKGSPGTRTAVHPVVEQTIQDTARSSHYCRTKDERVRRAEEALPVDRSTAEAVEGRQSKGVAFRANKTKTKPRAQCFQRKPGICSSFSLLGRTTFPMEALPRDEMKAEPAVLCAVLKMRRNLRGKIGRIAEAVEFTIAGEKRKRGRSEQQSNSLSIHRHSAFDRPNKLTGTYDIGRYATTRRASKLAHTTHSITLRVKASWSSAPSEQTTSFLLFGLLCSTASKCWTRKHLRNELSASPIELAGQQVAPRCCFSGALSL